VTKSLVIGVDAGATSTRVAVHALDGARVGYATAGPGNPSAHGLAGSVAAIGTALDRALTSVDASWVVASLAGIAGHGQALAPELAKLWAGHGITTAPLVTGDVRIAYAAGTPEPDGSLLLSGTGAVAARISGREIDEIADGLGWLLGDAGSGFWIGRAAAKAVVAGLDRGDTGGLLAELVVDHFLGPDRGPTPRKEADRLVRLAQADHMRLAVLSKLVGRAAAAGDQLALRIAHEAAGHLVATVGRVRESGPVVLAGSVLTSEGAVRQAVRELLAGVTVATAGDAAGAAAWLAALDLLPGTEARRLHAAFTATP
jgi:glucosamine kinase